MQEIVPERGLPGVIAPSRPQSLGVAVQVRQDVADIWGVKRHVNDGVRPIELPLELRGARRLADHNRTRRSPLIEPGRNLFTARSKSRFVDLASVGEIEAAVLEQRRQHDAMLARAVDMKRSV